MSAAEFGRAIRLDTIGEVCRTVSVEANAAERAALARRFDIVAIESLTGEVGLSRAAGGVAASGVLRAAVTQRCVASGEPVSGTIDEPFALIFVAVVGGETNEEIELSLEDCDTIEHDGQAIDIGEALAQTLALALDPFPRAKGAEAVLRRAGVISEEEAGPFGALAAMRERLRK